MQPLVDSTLRPFTSDQVTQILTCRSVLVRSGLELLDSTDSSPVDISDDLDPAGSAVSHDNTASIHGTVTLNIARALPWGVQRIRPYMVLTDQDSGLSGRWNLGVYVLHTPDAPYGPTPSTFQVSGSDKLYLLSDPIGDAYSVASGANVLTAAKAAILSADPSAVVQFDGNAASAALPNAFVLPLASSTISTWLDAVNGLLKTVAYEPVWMDWNGAYRSGPILDPAVRSPEFAFSADDELASIVGQERTVTADLWRAPNFWRFIAQNWPTTPVEGSGQYTVQNANTGPASQAAIGRVVRKVLYVNAADQPSLQAFGDQQVAADKRVIETVKAMLGPMPAQWHTDVATYQDSQAGGLMKVATTSWTLNLDGSDGQTVWQVVE